MQKILAMYECVSEWVWCVCAILDFFLNTSDSCSWRVFAHSILLNPVGDEEKNKKNNKKRITHTFYTFWIAHTPGFLGEKTAEKNTSWNPWGKVSCQQMPCIHRCVTTCAIEKVRLWLGAAPPSHIHMNFSFP